MGNIKDQNKFHKSNSCATTKSQILFNSVADNKMVSPVKTVTLKTHKKQRSSYKTKVRTNNNVSVKKFIQSSLSKNPAAFVSEFSKLMRRDPKAVCHFIQNGGIQWAQNLQGRLENNKARLAVSAFSLFIESCKFDNIPD